MMAPDSISSLPEGIMNVHDATYAKPHVLVAVGHGLSLWCVAFRLDLDRTWNMDGYLKGHIQDALWTIASALDKITKECLGDAQDRSVVIRTIEQNTWNSTLKLSPAVDANVSAKPLRVEFDHRAHRVLPMALGNLVRGKWQVAGVYDPSTNRFIENTLIIRWPATNKSAPRDWFTCKSGEKTFTRQPGQLAECVACPKGTFSRGGEATVCLECSAGATSLSRPAESFCSDCRPVLRCSCGMWTCCLCRLLPAR